jgi:glucose/arabinose dehydrogenase
MTTVTLTTCGSAYEYDRIQVRNPDRRWRVVAGKPVDRTGTGAGEFGRPVGIAVGADGTVWVADAGNNRIQRYGVGW